MDGDPEEWSQREEDWIAFWKERGKERVEKGGKAAVDGVLPLLHSIAAMTLILIHRIILGGPRHS